IEADQDEKQKKGNCADICNSRILCMELSLMYLNWFTVSLVYYGVSFNAGAFGDVFMNTFLSGLVEIPANLLCYIVLEKYMSELLTALSTLGKGAITFAFSSIYLYTSELFPTPMRQLAVGSSSMFARIGSMASPYLGSTLEDVWLPMPSVIFGVLSALAGSLVLLLPETKGQKLPDTVEEAEEIGR
ncbi:hypothetical protein LSH36_1273g00023, partial [Paralvinella palmiformis]